MGEDNGTRKLAIICSKGSLDMAYPGLVLANAARQAGVEAVLFFTFWGMEIIHKEKQKDLKVSTVGNPSMHMPTVLGGIPGMSAMASSMMKKKIDELDIPPIDEFVEMVHDAGAKLYACRMAADMMDIEEEDLVPQVEGIISAMDFIDISEGAQTIFI
jgi:peroxiredoxin family protein